MKTELRTILSLLEKGFVVLALLLLTSVRKLELISYGIYPITFFLIALHWKEIVRIGMREKLLWVFIGLVLSSVLWSAAPSTTLVRSLTFLGTTLFGAYLAGRYSLNEQLQLLAWALGLVAILSFLFVLTFPEYGMMTEVYAGAWRGINGHKNSFGRHMDISMLVFLLLGIKTHKRTWFMWAGVGFSFMLILLSNSKTSLVIALILLLLFPLYSALRWSYTWMIPFLITLVLTIGSMIVVLVPNAETILSAFGRDATLTGRTAIWAAVIDKIGEHPWFGYGYGGFWREWYGESAYVWEVTRWTPPHAHNGLLDVLLAVGIVGLLVLVTSFIMACFRAIAWVRLTTSATELWPLMYLTLMFLVNLTESTLGSKTIFWTLYVAALLSTHRNLVGKAEIGYFNKS